MSQKTLQKHLPEEMLNRFRSKEDLYKYLTQQGNRLINNFTAF